MLHPAQMPTAASSPSGLDSTSSPTTPQARLILVSNREPFTRKKNGKGEDAWVQKPGGLVSALTPIMKRADGVWVAWAPDQKEGTRRMVPGGDEPSFVMRGVPLSQTEVRRYYQGFANRALWPLCHYLLDRCAFEEQEWETYRRVNGRFADAAAEEAEEGDLVWIQDYHFCLAPQMVRERRETKGPIAYFHHVPFPTEQVFRVLPWREEVLLGLLGADLVGFHTKDYAHNFMGCCHEILGAQIDEASGTVLHHGRTTHVGWFPIGIDFEEHERIARTDRVAEQVAEIHRQVSGEKIILGVDRLDYTKGILERLFAIERLLERHPHYRGKISFVQIAVPSRTSVEDYRHLKQQVDETVGRINGQYSRLGWTPVIYQYRSLNREELIAQYRAADVALVTPLRDGMNLVAKEFIACRTEEDGVLVLSEFAGAGEDLGPDSVFVNPYNVNDVANGLDFALNMHPDEQRARMRRLREHVAARSIGWWLDAILTAAQESIA